MCLIFSYKLSLTTSFHTIFINLEKIHQENTMLLEIRSMCLNKENAGTNKVESKWNTAAVEDHKVFMAKYARSMKIFSYL